MMKPSIGIRSALVAALVAAGLVLGAADAQAQEAPRVTMTKYTIVLLKSGEAASDSDTAEVARIRTGHMANIRHMGTTGKLVSAGPVAGAEGVEGILIFRTGERAEVEAMLAADPAVAAGWLVAEYWDWYAPAGLRVVEEEAGRGESSAGSRVPPSR